MKKRRLLAVILAFVMSIQSVPAASAAGSAKTADALREPLVEEVPLPPETLEEAERIDQPDEAVQRIPDDQIAPMDELPSEPISGYCGGEGDGRNLTWTLDSDGVLTIRGTGKMRNYGSGSVPWGLSQILCKHRRAMQNRAKII